MTVLQKLKKIVWVLMALNIGTGLLLGSFTNYNFGDQEKVLGVTSVPEFSPEYIMHNDTFSSTKTFPTLDSIQNYLNKIDSPLKNYQEQGQYASYWIYNASAGITSTKYGVSPRVNPAVILAYLEKEQSLLSAKYYNVWSDPESKVKYAMGYGCSDGEACDDEYNGFVNQVNWGAFQLQYNYNLATSDKSDQYKLGKTITTLDEYNVYLSNAATAAQYRYTPHVYWGNYSLWKILTANGWGRSTQTYTYSELDEVNLGTKTSAVQPQKTYTNNKDINALLNKRYEFGDEGIDVTALQQFLKEKGYFTYPTITSTYGLYTKQAKDAFTRDQKVQFDLEGVNKELQNNCGEMLGKDWKYGEESETVKHLQECLKKMNLFDWPAITGYFGPATQKALEKARQENQKNLKVDKCTELKGKNWIIGEVSDNVSQLQECMQKAGFYNHESGITGKFGSYTNVKLNQWKGNNETNCETFKSESWTFGETGQRVVELQKCMSDAKIFSYTNGNTGNFGEVTKSALIKW